MFGGLKDGVAIITGAGGGMGIATAKRLAAEGCRIFGVDVSEAGLNKLRETLEVEGIQDLVTFACDTTNEAEVNRAVETCIRTFGKITILVNTAGIYTDRLMKDMDFAEWQRTLNINLNGVMFFCHAVLDNMLKNGYGKIINLTSQAGISGSVMHSHYAASKAGIIGMSRSIAREVAEYGITVNCIAPGIIKTPMTAHYTPEQVKNFMDKIPMKRFGEADDVAKVVEFLASDGADYITGQVYNVTGGWLMVS